MFAPRRLERAFQYLREQAKKRNDGVEPQDQPMELEKGDLWAMILAAFRVFAPVFLVLLALLILVFFFL